MLGSFLFVGCGKGDGNVCYGSGCTNSGGGNTSDGGSDGDDPGDTGGDDDDSGDTQFSISANLTYDSLENNISDYRGMFNLVAPNHADPEDLDRHSNIYQKEIIYHDVDAGVASALYNLLDGNFYPEVKCSYKDSPPYCQEFGRNYSDLPSDVVLYGIYMVEFVFNQGKATGCSEDSGVCDVTLIALADSKYRNNTNPIELDKFKQAFVGDYSYENEMKTLLHDIEKNATAVSLVTYTRYYNMNLTTYGNVNETIRIYNSQLSLNNGTYQLLPQIPMKPSGSNGEGVTLKHDGVYYQLKNTYVPFESKKVQYDVNETDSNSPNYWMYYISSKGGSNTSSSDIFNGDTLCQRTANSTEGNATEPATNATYTCEKGNGNITAHWSLQGKSVDLGW
jgi:hypothetical protein